MNLTSIINMMQEAQQEAEGLSYSMLDDGGNSTYESEVFRAIDWTLSEALSKLKRLSEHASSLTHE